MIYLPRKLLENELKLIVNLNKPLIINKLKIEPFYIHINKYTDELNILWGHYKNNEYLTPPIFRANYILDNNNQYPIPLNELKEYNFYEEGQLILYNHFYLPKKISSGDILLYLN